MNIAMTVARSFNQRSTMHSTLRYFQKLTSHIKIGDRQIYTFVDGSRLELNDKVACILGDIK